MHQIWNKAVAIHNAAIQERTPAKLEAAGALASCGVAVATLAQQTDRASFCLDCDGSLDRTTDDSTLHAAPKKVCWIKSAHPMQ
jgi:hypothetical protein